MSAHYLIPAAETRTEIKVSNSRFIATAAPVFSVQEAKAFIERMKGEFRDATHNVPAYVIGHGAATIAHCNDDGEPAGTAGRPILAVLQGSGLGDVAVVVTRYFGGTKLGTGGLVRAYSEAAKAVLAALPRAEKVRVQTVRLTLPYSYYERVKSALGEWNGRILDQTFAAEVTITAQLPVANIPPFQAALRELSHGGLKAEVLGEASYSTRTNAEPADAP